MPKQDPGVRKKNFSEVALGLSEEQALIEAQRCLQCKNRPCVNGCPVQVQIPEFIKLITEKKYVEAALKIKETNNLPAMCGRVCPQEDQCEKECILQKTGKPIGIGYLERFVADRLAADPSHRKAVPPYGPQGNMRPPQGGTSRIAIVGSGPASLTCAADLAVKGYQVKIFEAFHDTGGVLRYGIPEFRLPKKIVEQEVEAIKKMGVEIELNCVVGATVTLEELFKEGYRAIFLGLGAGAPSFLGIPGENLNGVYSANEFLTRVNLMKGYDFPKVATPVHVGKHVAVVGGGNVAMDAARTSLRLGAEKVTIVYRRSKKELPARFEEVENAEEEGVELKLLTNPKRLIGNKDGWVEEMECLQMELGEPDESGRRRPVVIPNSEFILKVDTVVIAIGNQANPLLTKRTKGLKLNKWGNIEVDEDGKTSLEGVYAGGDIVTGAATVIEAMGAGRKAAISIDKYLT
ncbi:MAG: NADPH-dependent glutamate synthase [Candidatus Margulisbacteria bacterium]|nr:NADPH-dependent glutamate synthase [Candidatus Margulisiibacteriota bacterium]